MKNKPTVAILGLGLIGGSLALEFKRHRLASQVIGISTSVENREEALRQKAVDVAYKKLGDFLQTADIVFICTPVKIIETILLPLKKNVSEHTIITDVGSTKEQIVDQAKKLKLKNFIGGHPIAGTEKSGMKAAQLGLFKNKKWILTSEEKSNPANFNTLKKLLTAMGAKVEVMKAKDHDALFAAFSHVPNLISFALASSLNHKKLLSKIDFAGSSLRDMTRLAASPVAMWRDIALSNSVQILRSLDLFEKKILELKCVLKKRDARGLERFLREGQKVREVILPSPRGKI
ncbi:MAG: prephenate dehydrogenase/arogenate dehydrogenase family protein [Deltaproteobacteria bacterium]|nr:prephenate dehydrogenase/arogenate dehydrogenase family protein [Deltaproteobacteria bacterium]